MMKILYILLLVTLNVFGGNAIKPEAHFIVSKNKKFMLTMSRPILGENGTFTSKGKCTAYKILDNGMFDKLWTVDGWYSHQLNLSKDGKYLVRRGDRKIWHRFSDPKLVIAFYEEGKLLKQYSVEDISKYITIDKNKEYWEENSSEFPSLNHYIYKLKTKDGQVLAFDIKTGEVIKKSK